VYCGSSLYFYHPNALFDQATNSTLDRGGNAHGGGDGVCVIMAVIVCGWGGEG